MLRIQQTFPTRWQLAAVPKAESVQPLHIASTSTRGLNLENNKEI